MKNLLFSLLYIGGIIPSIVFGQTASSEDILDYLQNSPPTTTNTRQAPPSPQLLDFLNKINSIESNNSITINGVSYSINEEDKSILKFKPDEKAADYIKRIQTENASRAVLGKTPLPDPVIQINPNAQRNTQQESLAPKNSTIFPDTTKTPTDISVLNNLVNPKTFEGVPEGKNQQPLSKILNQLFFIGLVITIILAIIMIIVGGIQYMTIDAMASKESGKKRVQAALGGLVLAFSAILILNTINPNITSLRIVFPKLKEIKPINIVGDLQLQSGTRFDPVTGQPNSIGGVGANSIVKGNFSNVTIADLRPHLGSNYSDSDLQAFIDAGRQYGIDPRFLASVSKFETANGTSKAFRDGRNNAMGTSNSVGPIGFSSVRDSIFTQANNLVKEGGYYSKATTIKQIGDIYSPSVNPATGKPYQNDINGTNWSWAESVSSNYDQMTQGRTGN